MDRDSRNTIIVLIAAVVIVLTIFGSVNLMSGVSPPYTVVESQSMQHGTESELGVIDTGDMVIVKDPDKVEIQSFVEGYASGYTSFGSYGDVIIYERGNNTKPVIHRAIVWLDCNISADENEKVTWSAPSLEHYTDSEGEPLWYCEDSNDFNNLSGSLVIYGLSYDNKSLSINLDNLAIRNTDSGYLTLGDYNNAFDQSGGIVNKLVSKDMIRSVAWIEIPWIGCLKLILKGNSDVVNNYAPNSIPCLTLCVFAVIVLLFGLNFVIDYYDYSKYFKLKRKDLLE